MNELVLLIDKRVVTNSLIVAEKFGKRHDHILRDIEKLEKDVPNFGEMFQPSVEYDAYNRTRKIYIMNRDGWTLLVMGFTGSKAMQFKVEYINRFNAMEEKIKAQVETERPKLPMTYKEALLALVEAEEQKEAMQLQITEYRPKVEYHDTVLQSSKLVTVTNIAKDLGMGATTLNRILYEKGIQYKKGKNWVLYAKYDRLIKEGYADYHINEFGQTLKWTEKGRKWIIEQLQTQLAGVN